MGLEYRCDICGKLEGEKSNNKLVEINDNAIKIQVPNYKGEKYDIMVNVVCQHEKDTLKLEKFYKDKEDNKTNNLMTLFDSLDGGASAKKLDYEDFVNPCPNICNNCKKEMAKLAHRYGNYEKFAKIFTD